MNVELNPKYERQIARLAKYSGRSFEEALEAIIVSGLSTNSATEDPIEIDEWKPQLMAFLDEMHTLPIEGRTDEFSGADHDDILYPRYP